ncbi:N-acyl-L-homoserine lactone synthetase [Loktanella fryxellensis]|uniref:Acyl-homoserine-lactone synthase n=1 Tax=Loktanella fryxellensis TaxID=245187 RepID=A0A1H8DGJ9_9RHOB|nr:acyl-homoserine-lactone synthase [Loktanella fryxellensis]SEN05597.1 N-acyl-L-homoserine lactone synthetase [Loktanella fryxellensis]
MIRYLTTTALAAHPGLQAGMHRDRTAQFRDRLGWDVQVDAQGWERDQYDACDPLYVVWEPQPGVHGGSMRLLPMSGRTMVNEQFAALLPAPITDPAIWECTRFCLSPHAGPRVAGLLMLAGGEVMRAHALTHLLGVFDARMIRVYQAIGAVPEVLGRTGPGRDAIGVGLWPYRPDDRLRVLRRAGVSSEVSEAWFARAFGPDVTPRPLAAATAITPSIAA